MVSAACGSSGPAAPGKKKSRKFMTPAEKKEETAREVAAELKKKREELGEKEQNKRVRERMRLYQEQSLKDAEETRERRGWRD